MRFWITLIIAALVISTVALYAPAPMPSQAQRPDAPTYALRGQYPVGTRNYVIEDAERPLEVAVWYPALNPDNLPEAHQYAYSFVQFEGRALLDAAPDTASAPYPLIIFSHGSGAFRYQSLFYTEHLASYGFVVMAVDHVGNTITDASLAEQDSDTLLRNLALRPMDVYRQIAFAQTLNTDGDFVGMIDMDTIGITGHSLGGYTTLASAGARLDFAVIQAQCAEGNLNVFEQRFCKLLENVDEFAQLQGQDSAPDDLFLPALSEPRIKAIVPLAPFTPPFMSDAGLATVTAPTLLIVGSMDELTPADPNSTRPYTHINSPAKGLVVLENANHYIFVDECGEVAIRMGFFASCSDSVWDMQRAHDLINHFTTAFFLSTLKNDAAALEALRPVNADFVGVDYQNTWTE